MFKHTLNNSNNSDIFAYGNICDRPYQYRAEVGNSVMARNPLIHHEV